MAKTVKLQCNEKRMPLSEVADAVSLGVATAKVVCRTQQIDGNAILLCFEKYFFRNNGFASLTVMLTEDENRQDATIVGFGGGSGILNFSYGANDEFAEDASGALKKCGFEVLPEDVNTTT